MTNTIPAWVGGLLTPVEKLEVHRKGLKHKAVSVFAMDGTKTLIQKRAAGKYHSAGLWANTCCTHPRWNEDASLCAVRRLNDELGIQGIDVTFRDTVEYRARVEPDLIEHEVVDIFTTEFGPEHPMTLNPNEVEAVVWIEVEELLDRIKHEPEKYSAWLRIYISKHLDRILPHRSPS